jgi:hypothetical protein
VPGSVVETPGSVVLKTGGQALAQPPLQTEVAVSEVR